MDSYKYFITDRTDELDRYLFDVRDHNVFAFGRRFGWSEVAQPIEIKRVIFNDPATIVFWKDGTKTVVKATNEPFDKEKGLAMCIAKKWFGNTGKYFDIFKQFIDNE